MDQLKQTKSESKILQNRGYRLIKKIGIGSYAKVYLGEYRSYDISKPIACKVINTQTVPDEFNQKFLPREIEILSKLSHPHIIHIHSIFQRRHKIFIFMRYAENGDLLEFMLHYGPVGEKQARIWMRQLALALQYLHELQIAHRDLKCENILVTSNYNVKITDFGFARRVMDPVSREYLLSETFCGSLQYAAPEVIHADPYDPKYADMWSLGVILFAVLNKAMPFEESSPKDLYRKQMSRSWQFRPKIAEHTTTDCVMLVKCLLDPVPAKRPNIDQMVYSDWIVKDPKLRVMTHLEFCALASARLQNNETKTRSVIEIKTAAPKAQQILPMRCSESMQDISGFKPISTKQASALRQAQSKFNIHEEVEKQELQEK